jgi:hypothetical protein
MPNFFTDNDDIQFLFDHMDLRGLAAMMENDFAFAADYEFAPIDADDALDNYRRILEVLGDLAGNVIAPTAEETDRVGNVLNEDGTVTYAPGIAEAIKRLGQADMMGFTLPYRYGGLNCPQLLYSMSNDIVSRADASLMNIYGLQGIAETINAFADDTTKAQYLPDMASGKHTGAMVLTEPDAGSDLQAVKVRAYQDDSGQWFVHGVKRFITNGCGEILLVLARTEPETTDGRGLSLLLVERGPRVKVRRLEEKLGIHGSPTCELFFDDAPARLIGETKRGLVTYVMSLMNGARIGIASQSLGIGEAAYRVARSYAHSRRQFGKAIEDLPAVRELLVDMSVDLQAARALTYYASYCVDLEIGATRKAEGVTPCSDDEQKTAKKQARVYKRYNGLLTPMSKYYASEMSMRVANQAVAVLGGSGYMKDYPVERHLRDSRITTIYEGTTQLQVVAAVRGVTSGTADTLIGELLDRDWPADQQEAVDRLSEARGQMAEAIGFVKSQPGGDYMDLYGRRLVDMAITLIVGALLADHATASPRKQATLGRWLAWKLPQFEADQQMIMTGDRQILQEFEALAGPVPAVE